LELQIADGQDLINEENFWLKVSRDGKGEAYVHSRRIVFYGVSIKLSSSAKETISSNLRTISHLLTPKIAPERKVFLRPVSSG